MAKFGEGDSRWIVTDRPDGTNVHNWHWSETDCIEYSRNFFNNSLTGLPVLNGEGGLFIKINKVDKLDGEAYVNIRKGKIIPGYELSLTVSWDGESKGADGVSLGKWDGTVEIPYVSDENAGEAPEVKVTFKDDGPIGKRIKEAFIANGKAVILQKVKEYEEAMARGGPCREELEAKKVAPKATAATSKAEPQVAVKKDEVKAKQKEKEKERRGYRTIKLSEKFRCRAVDLYEILMDENRWKGFTQSNAKISKEVGGEFSIFDGSVTGTHVDLQEGKLIVQKWRFGNWADGVFSTVKLNFEEPESGVTVVKLVQTDVPEEDRYGNETVVENTERGWRDLIFQRIRAIFGFGL